MCPIARAALKTLFRECNASEFIVVEAFIRAHLRTPFEALWNTFCQNDRRHDSHGLPLQIYYFFLKLRQNLPIREFPAVENRLQYSTSWMCLATEAEESSVHMKTVPSSRPLFSKTAFCLGRGISDQHVTWYPQQSDINAIRLYPFISCLVWSNSIPSKSCFQIARIKPSFFFFPMVSMISFSLKKPSEIIKFSHSPSIAKPTTNPCPRVPHPHGC